jgi:hypothetical protein
MDRHLIRTWRGAALSNPSRAHEENDYFVRRPGAAVSERGFHNMLADFLGWELPMLQRDEETEVPLYLEMIFPLIYVEQKRGWGAIQATMPTYGVPNARRRAIEFILGLGVYRRARERRELLGEIERFRGQYRQAVALFTARLDGTGVVLQGLEPDMPTRWPAVEPALLASVDAGEWSGLAEHLADLRNQLQTVRADDVPSAEEQARELSEALSERERQLDSLSAAGGELRRSVALDDDQLAALNTRVEALDEDRRRYRDAITLRELGSNVGPILEGDDCPACHRPLPAALVVAAAPPPMSLEQNLEFIQEQIQTFRLMWDDINRHRGVASQQLAALRTRIDEVRQEVRAARSTLTSPSQSPSIAAVRRQLQLEDRVERLESIEQDFYGLIADIRPLIDAAQHARERLLSLPTERLDESDEARLGALETSVVSQLGEYGFRSFDVDTIGISHDTYLPTREGFDLGFVTSASDAIRIVWSYLLGLLEVSKTFETNHPGLLMFDEPRQQAADPLSFQALLRRAAMDAADGAQILFATSEPEPSLAAFLDGLTYTQTTFEGMALERRV